MVIACAWSVESGGVRPELMRAIAPLRTVACALRFVCAVFWYARVAQFIQKYTVHALFPAHSRDASALSMAPMRPRTVAAHALHTSPSDKYTVPPRTLSRRARVPILLLPIALVIAKRTGRLLHSLSSSSQICCIMCFL